MEDDDEFGDLYANVLRSCQASPILQSAPTQPKQSLSNCLIDLNVQSYDEEILYSVPNSNPKFNFTSSHHSQTLVFKSKKALSKSGVARSSDSHQNLNLVDKKEDQEMEEEKGLAQGVINWALNFPGMSVSRVLQSVDNVKLQARSFGDPSLMDESKIDVVKQKDDKDNVLVEKDEVLMDKIENFEKFDKDRVSTCIGDMGSKLVIPHLPIPGVLDGADNLGDANFMMHDKASENDDCDSDSDSEDDLQIILNDNNHHGPMVTRVIGSDNEDKDGDLLVIVAGNMPGEKKQLGYPTKMNGRMDVRPKIGYNNHFYHPYHSQFKYVRPGATPIFGATPLGLVGASSQVHLPINMNVVASHGRGDWRPIGIKNTSPMQKSFQLGFGMPVWGNNTSGSGFGSGLQFKLPPHKTIFEVDVDSLKEKPWRLPNIDISDFFNFGLNEGSWKDYSKQLEQSRLEVTMQRKICIYESGGTEQKCDPDLPLELAVTRGIHDISSKNAHIGNMDAGKSDIAKRFARVHPPLPTGKAIQVEIGYGERLPSIDTLPPQIRDSDAIEIVLQDSVDDDSFTRNDVTEQNKNDPSMKDFRGGKEIKGNIAEQDIKHFYIPHVYNGRKRKLLGRRAPFMNYIHDNFTEGGENFPFLQEALVQRLDSSGKTFAYHGRDVGTLHEDSQAKAKARGRSLNMTCNGSSLDKRFLDNQEEDSVESIGGKHSPRLSSHVPVESGEGLDAEDSDDDKLVLPDGSSRMDIEEMAIDKTTTTDTHIDENLFHSVKKQKISSRVEQSSFQEIDDRGDLKVIRSSENSKARLESIKDYHRLRDSVDKKVVYYGRAASMGNLKRLHSEDEQSVRGKGRDERYEMEKNCMVEKGRDDPYSCRDWDLDLAHHSQVKNKGVDRRNERDNSKGTWQQRDDDPHSWRAIVEDTRMRKCDDEIRSRYRNKVQKSKKMDKDELHQLRKQLDNSKSMGYHDKDVGSWHRGKDNNVKSQYENINDLHRKRRKEKKHSRREAKKEEILHGHGENTSHQKRERDDALNLHKRDEHVRTRDDDRDYVRHKKERWIHKERRGERKREKDEWHRLKQSHKESLLKQKRKKRQGGVKSTRSAEGNAWVSHSRVKDDFKGSDRDCQFNDIGQHSDQLKRRDQVEDGSLSQIMRHENVHECGNQFNNDERQSRLEKESIRNDCVIDGSDNNMAHEKRQREDKKE